MRTTLRSRFWAAALLVAAGTTLSIAATAATGSQPGRTVSIPDTAFQPVNVPPIPGASSAPGAVDTRALDGRDSRLQPLDDLREPVLSTTPPERAQPSIGAAGPIVVPVPTPTPKPPSGGASGGGSGGGGSGGGGGSTSHSLRGYASYYCRAGVSICTAGYPDVAGVQAYGAAGPRLRAALGDWRGRVVYVDGIRVKLIDWCQCYKGESNEKLIDLYYDVFKQTGSSITIRW